MWQTVMQADECGISRGLTPASSTEIAAAGLRLRLRGHESGSGPMSTEMSLDAREPSLLVYFLVAWCRFPGWQTRSSGALAFLGPHFAPCTVVVLLLSCRASLAKGLIAHRASNRIRTRTQPGLSRGLWKGSRFRRASPSFAGMTRRNREGLPQRGGVQCKVDTLGAIWLRRTGPLLNRVWLFTVRGGDH